MIDGQVPRHQFSEAPETDDPDSAIHSHAPEHPLFVALVSPLIAGKVLF
jgi:hypothetical protein